MTTKIAFCQPCNTGPGATFQDHTYGKNMRVHNDVKSDPGVPKGRCTVCGTIRTK